MDVRLPTAEEWRDIQGGSPTLLISPSGKLVEIIHAYPNSNNDGYTGPLSVVPTPREQLIGSRVLRFTNNTLGSNIEVPAALLWQHHGNPPCEQRSEVPGSRYERLAPDQVDAYIRERQLQGWQRSDPVRR